VLVLDPAIVVLLLFGARALARLLSDALGRFPEDGMRVLIVGCGEPGAMCLRALRARGDGRVTPVGMLDDDPTLRRRLFHGVPVVGVTADLGRVLTELRPEELVLSKLPPDDEIEAYRAAAEAAGVRLLVSPYARAFVPL
jgi:FlaA1/EpsC-like NDP-sugar epimerase